MITFKQTRKGFYHGRAISASGAAYSQAGAKI
ncbi:MAG: hypothetical protein K0S27_707 [Gammaproteobacteria bacterium]|nr:hypothetical protein [Gammaproteobacteria bacterium]